MEMHLADGHTCPRVMQPDEAFHQEFECMPVVASVYSMYQSKYESAVAQVVRRWSLDQRVAGSCPGRVAVFAFLGKMLNLDCLCSPRSVNRYQRGSA